LDAQRLSLFLDKNGIAEEDMNFAGQAMHLNEYTNTLKM